MDNYNQVIHSIKQNKPIYWKGELEENTTHYRFVKTKDVAFTINVTEAKMALRNGLIEPAPIPSTHYQCCGQWKTNKHMWWCKNEPRYPRHSQYELKQIKYQKAKLAKRKRLYKKIVEMYRKAGEDPKELNVLFTKVVRHE